MPDLLRGNSAIPDLRWTNDVPPIEDRDALRSVETFTGLRVTVLKGDGKDSVLREVVHYFDEYGNRVAVVDPFEEKPHGAGL